MAHFAQLNEHDIVQQVIVVHNNELLDENGHESENNGVKFCEALLGGTWLQTSYNGTFRKNFAGTGYTYNSVLDAFIPPKPFNSWILNEITCQWYSPTPMPEDGKLYSWNEPELRWDLLDT